MSVRTRMGLVSLLGLCLAASNGFGHGGHPDDHENPARIVEEGASPWSRFGVSADLRPSAGAGGESYFMDNEVALSYQLSRSLSTTYTQRFQVSLNSAKLEAAEPGPDFHEHHDGFLQVNAADIGSIGRVTLNYEGRVYAPTSVEKRNRGFVTALGNFVKATIPVVPSVTFCLTEGPVFHAYSQSDFETENGLVTNPLLENRLSASIDVLLAGDRVRISLPVFWHEFFHYSSRQNARFGGKWSHALWISPEVIWKLSDSTQIGVAYHSENLFADYTYSLGLNEGLRGGAFQAVYQLTL